MSRLCITIKRLYERHLVFQTDQLLQALSPPPNSSWGLTKQSFVRGDREVRSSFEEMMQTQHGWPVQCGVRLPSSLYPFPTHKVASRISGIARACPPMQGVSKAHWRVGKPLDAPRWAVYHQSIGTKGKRGIKLYCNSSRGLLWGTAQALKAQSCRCWVYREHSQTKGQEAVRSRWADVGWWVQALFWDTKTVSLRLTLGLVQLQTLSEDFSATVNVSLSSNSSGLIATVLNEIFLLSFPKYIIIYKIHSDISFFSRFGWLANLDYKFFRAKVVSYTVCVHYQKQACSKRSKQMVLEQFCWSIWLIFWISITYKW